MTQADSLLALLRTSPLTLGQILHAEGGRFAPEYRRIFSDLRREGYDVRHHKAKHCQECVGSAGCPAWALSANCYKLHEAAKVEANGQLAMWG